MCVCVDVNLVGGLQLVDHFEVISKCPEAVEETTFVL